jgi:chitinase
MKLAPLTPLLLCFCLLVWGQGTAPTFQHKTAERSYTLLGQDPARAVTTTIPTVLVNVSLAFEAKRVAGKPFVMDAAPDVARILHSPVFADFDFPSGGKSQYVDAMLRSTFPEPAAWHTLLGKPEVKAVKIQVPPSYGYVLTSKKSGRSIAVADLEFVQREVFKEIPSQPGKLVIAVTHNTTYYADGDATICCGWGTHGVDPATGNSFVLSTYLRNAPAIVKDEDLQPLTQQLAEYVNDPLHDPRVYVHRDDSPGNTFPRWMRPASMQPGDQGSCGGSDGASSYFLLEPTETNRKNNFPVSKAFEARTGNLAYHLENVALLPWYTGSEGGGAAAYSFPDPHALNDAAKACPARGRHMADDEDGAVAHRQPTAAPAPLAGTSNGHALIGYWAGYGGAGSTFPLKEISPQWDVVIIAFSTPAEDAPEGTMRFGTPSGFDAEQFKSQIAYLKSKGKKVLISLGGGGQFFKLDDPKSISNFVSSVTETIADYGFDGIDIDYENPSLALAAGDSDFRHPATPSMVNLIAGLRQLREHFGPRFMISLVPEGSQVPAGYATYGGQFGTYLALSYGIRDILSFMDVQDYNTPPLEGLDGEIYQAGTVDYHAAMTELVLHGFNAGGDPKHFFPPLPADKVAVGFLTGDATPEVVTEAMNYLITGKAPAGTTYKLRKTGGYPGLIGAMFWTIDDDRLGNYNFSNVVGPQLHGFPPAK